ncbi:hypothetical protein MKEN_00504100 [Mycena kentingensis (nom. inval.)]|nr:hypothetical protein MKEN_00504100 [Mycena kentingensis (nom. inval.)]
MALATPVARAACNPALAGAGLSIASGGFEIGYTSSTAGASAITQAFSLAPEFIGENTTVSNGGFLLKDANQDNHAAGLFLTFVDGAPKLETLITPQDGHQGWGFICAECGNFTPSGRFASSCNVVSGWTGQCLQIGTKVGDPVQLANCNGLGSGPQYFDLFV